MRRAQGNQWMTQGQSKQCNPGPFSQCDHTLWFILPVIELANTPLTLSQQVWTVARTLNLQVKCCSNVKWTLNLQVKGCSNVKWTLNLQVKWCSNVKWTLNLQVKKSGHLSTQPSMLFNRNQSFNNLILTQRDENFFIWYLIGYSLLHHTVYYNYSSSKQ